MDWELASSDLGLFDFDFDIPTSDHTQTVDFDFESLDLVLNLPDPDQIIPNHESDSTNTQAATTDGSMGPPMSSRKRKAADCLMESAAPLRKKKAQTLKPEDWEPRKLQIIELYVNQNRPLDEVMSIIEMMTGFKATKRQYVTRIKKWDLNKNIQPEEMEAIVRKRQHRKLMETHKSALHIEVRGRVVEPEKIERWMRANAIREDQEYALSPNVPTPPAVLCRTISDRGTPAPSPRTMTISVASPFVRSASPWPAWQMLLPNRYCLPVGLALPPTLNEERFYKKLESHLAQAVQNDVTSGPKWTSLPWIMDLSYNQLCRDPHKPEHWQAYRLLRSLAKQLPKISSSDGVLADDCSLSQLVWASSTVRSLSPGFAIYGFRCGRHPVVRLHGAQLVLRWSNPCDSSAGNLISVFYLHESSLLTMKLFFDKDGEVQPAGAFAAYRTFSAKLSNNSFLEAVESGDDAEIGASLERINSSFSSRMNAQQD